MFPEAAFDLVFLCTALGEIPDRAAVLNQCYRALKAGGMLSITEKFGDPHYQSRSTVKRLAEEAGFQLLSIQGRWWFFTANFVKPLRRIEANGLGENWRAESSSAATSAARSRTGGSRFKGINGNAWWPQ